MAKFCKSCGVAIKPGSRFCVGCGVPILAAVPEPVVTPGDTPEPSSDAAYDAPRAALPPEKLPEAMVPMPPPAFTPQPAPASVESVRSETAAARPGRSLLYPVIGVLVAAAIGGAGYWAWSKKQEADLLARQLAEKQMLAAKEVEAAASRREEEQKRILKEEEERRQQAEQDRVAAEARAAQQADKQARAQAPAAATGATGYEVAQAAIARSDFRAAQAACQSPAQAGDGRCQNLMGLLYVNGQVGTRGDADLRVAADWFKRAAQQNLPAAQFNLALMYERGMGTPRDVNTARLWFQRAAAQGHLKAAQALTRLGNSSSE